MDILQETKDSYSNKKTFFNHVFSTTEEGQGELLNVGQYAIMGVIPVILLNKFIQRFIPEADGEKSSLEITFEIFMQLIIMFCGIVIIHRIITYAPTYSGFKYDNLSLTNVILAFLMNLNAFIYIIPLIFTELYVLYTLMKTNKYSITSKKEE